VREEGSDCAGPSTTENHVQIFALWSQVILYLYLCLVSYVHILDWATDVQTHRDATKAP
jgi:hypothetical protein